MWVKLFKNQPVMGVKRQTHHRKKRLVYQGKEVAIIFFETFLARLLVRLGLLLAVNEERALFYDG